MVFFFSTDKLIHLNVLRQSLHAPYHLPCTEVNLQCFPLCYSYIDQGRNPNLYTRDCLEKALTKNEQVKGKVDNFKVSPVV